MSEYVVRVKSAGVQVCLVFDALNWYQFFLKSDFKNFYIPGIEIIEDRYAFKPGDDLSVIRVTKGFQKKIVFTSKGECIYQNGIYNDKDVVTLVEYILERERQRQGVYCIHSASIVFQGRGVIFWGASTGIGKTRMALFLNENYNANFFSDEKTLLSLSRNEIVGGVPVAYLSKDYLKRKYGEKDFLNIKGNAKLPVTIAFMVYINVEDNVGDPVIEEWPADKFNWHLYEELSRKIRGTSRRIFNNTLPVPSVDEDSISQKRSRSVEEYCRSHRCFYMKGNEEILAGEIAGLLAE